jgi:tRNA (mo5U34)-methyltransferase
LRIGKARWRTNLVKWSKLVSYIDNYDWKNKVVLDVGASDGFFTVEMARRGAIVYSIEINSNRLKKLNYVVDKLKIKDSVTILDQNIYDIDFKKLPNFDLVICMGFLHRVPDFYSVMSMISEI